MPIKMVSIGFNFAVDDIVELELTSTVALADADIVFFTPCFGSYFLEDDRLSSGKSYMNAGAAIRLTSIIQHWRTEISHAANAGKTIIALFEAPQTFVIEAGRTYSGSGRSRVPSIQTSRVHNYDAFPVDLSGVTPCISSAIVPTKNAGTFAARWKEIAHYFQAQAYFSAPDGAAILELADGSKRTVGAVFGEAKNFFLLPDFRLPSAFFEEGDSDAEWSDSGRQFVQSIKTFALALHKSLRSGDEAEPDWAKGQEFSFDFEAIGATQVQKLREEQANLEEKIKEIENSIHPVASLRRLLHGTGGRLEHAVRSAFEMLGFVVSTYRDEEREIDLIVEADGYRFVGEVEGKDSKSIDVNKLSQLERIMAEDFERSDVSEYARGLLIGNAFRLKTPRERDAFFTTKVVQAAERRGIVLIETVDLFLTCRAIINGDEKRRAQAREAIIRSTGGVVRLQS